MSKKKIVEKNKRVDLHGVNGFAGGKTIYMDAPIEYRGTSNQVCGLWMFPGSSSTSIVGVPLGFNLLNGLPFCSDPISWFDEAKYISNPSMFVLGRPGLGKSTLIRRQVLGMISRGIHPMVLGDVKPDYVDIIEYYNGQSIKVGLSHASLNILNPGNIYNTLSDYSGKIKKTLLGLLRDNQFNILLAVLSIVRDGPITSLEQAVLYRALGILNVSHVTFPRLSDLIKVLQESYLQFKDLTQVHTKEEYIKKMHNLITTMIIFLEGYMGKLLASDSVTPIDVDHYTSTCYDLSEIGDYDINLQAAILLSCWSEGFAMVDKLNVLADNNLIERKVFYIVLDELWRAIRCGYGIVDRIDMLTRLNRKYVLGQVMITHTLDDLLSLTEEKDRLKASGFVERSGIIACGGLSQKELHRLENIISFSDSEREMIINWSSPQFIGNTAKNTTPPGCGKFIFKVGTRPGIPAQISLIDEELSLNDTNKRWNTRVK